ADLPGEGHRLADLDHEGLRGELLDERAGADEDRQGLLEELPAVVGDGQPEVEGPILQEGARDGVGGDGAEVSRLQNRFPVDLEDERTPSDGLPGNVD